MKVTIYELGRSKGEGRYEVFVVNDKLLFRRERRDGKYSVGKWKFYGGANPDTDYEYVTEGWDDDFVGTAQTFPVRRSDGERINLKDIAREVRIGDKLVVSPIESERALEMGGRTHSITTLSGRVSAIINQPGFGTHMALSPCYDDPTPI